MKEKIIIIEGPQGAGKTTVTDYIRNTLPYTNLYRLSGTADSSKTGLAKSEKMYDDLLNYMKSLEHSSINLLFDRTFFSEEVYCRLGFKEYSFTEIYKQLVKRLDDLDFDIYYVTLYLKDTSLFEERLAERKGKAVIKYAKFNIESSINQQNMYLQVADELKKESKNIKVINIDASKTKEEVLEDVAKNIGMK